MYLTTKVFTMSGIASTTVHNYDIRRKMKPHPPTQMLEVVMEQ